MAMRWPSYIRPHARSRLLSRLRAAGCLAVLVCAAACTAPTPGGVSAVQFDNPQARRDVPAISVLAPPDAQLLPVVKQLRNELEDDFDVLVTP